MVLIERLFWRTVDMRLGKKLIYSVILVMFLSIMFITSPCQVFSQQLSWGGKTYSGNYDLTKPHVVNDWGGDGYIEGVVKAVYQQCRAWGVTHEGCLAVIGNMYRESSGCPSRTQGDVAWEDFCYGTTGLGLFQWTYYSRQDQLFDTAAEMGKQWTDLAVQLTEFKKRWVDQFPDRYFDSSYHDTFELTSYFVNTFEKPEDDGAEASRRYAFAQEWEPKVKGLEPKDYDGVLDTGSATDTASDSSGEVSSGIISEWELMGMPIKSGLTADIGTLSLGDRSDLSATDMVNISSIGEDISMTKTYNAWTTVRVIIVFIGLLMLTYALMLMLALFVDKFNNIFDFSMIGIITFGAIHFSDDKYSSNGEEDVVRTTDTKRMVILIIVIALIGGILVSGGVLPFILRAVYKVTSAITG